MSIGSAVAPGTPESAVQWIRFLTTQGIREKRDLNEGQIEGIRNELRNKTLRDILWRYTEGPHYDVFLNLIGMSR